LQQLRGELGPDDECVCPRRVRNEREQLGELERLIELRLVERRRVQRRDVHDLFARHGLLHDGERVRLPDLGPLRLHVSAVSAPRRYQRKFRSHSIVRSLASAPCAGG
jgi:hypothetical protein